MKKLKTKKTERCSEKNRAVVKSVESVLRLGGSLWCERFVKEVGLEPEVKEREEIMDGESGELTQ